MIRGRLFGRDLHLMLPENIVGEVGFLNEIRLSNPQSKNKVAVIHLDGCRIEIEVCYCTHTSHLVVKETSQLHHYNEDQVAYHEQRHYPSEFGLVVKSMSSNESYWNTKKVQTSYNVAKP